MVNKHILVEKAIHHIEQEILDLQSTMNSAHAAMKDAPGAMQSHSDTTRSDKERLLVAYSKQLSEKQTILRGIHALKIQTDDTIKAGSLVELLENGITHFYFIIPVNLGKVDIEGVTIEFISPASPIARALHDHSEGDLVKVKIPNGIRELEIVTIE